MERDGERHGGRMMLNAEFPMKHTTTILVVFALCISAFHLTACGDVFTKSNAAEIGGVLAKSSLELAVRVIAGEQLNLNKEVSLLGLQTASNAVAKVTYNLSAPASLTPQNVVSAAAVHAQDRIENAAVPDPAIAAKAQEIAAQASVIASERLGASVPAGASAGH